MSKNLIIVLLIMFCSYTAFSQTNSQKDAIFSEHASCGLGYGLEYGKIGGHIIFYPQRNVGIFFSLGSATIDVAWEVGLKLKILPNTYNLISPYLIGMYGYNFTAMVSDDDLSSGYAFDKINYGTTFGAGLDIRFKHYSNNYLSLAVLFPSINRGDVNGYRNFLQQTYGLSFSDNPSTVVVSVGYNIILPISD